MNHDAECSVSFWSSRLCFTGLDDSVVFFEHKNAYLFAGTCSAVQRSRWCLLSNGFIGVAQKASVVWHSEMQCISGAGALVTSHEG